MRKRPAGAALEGRGAGAGRFLTDPPDVMRGDDKQMEREGKGGIEKGYPDFFGSAVLGEEMGGGSGAGKRLLGVTTASGRAVLGQGAREREECGRGDHILTLTYPADITMAHDTALEREGEAEQDSPPPSMDLLDERGRDVSVPDVAIRDLTFVSHPSDCQIRTNSKDNTFALLGSAGVRENSSLEKPVPDNLTQRQYGPFRRFLRRLVANNAFTGFVALCILFNTVTSPLLWNLCQIFCLPVYDICSYVLDEVQKHFFVQAG